MKRCCRECGVVLELRTFGYGEIHPECPICGTYLEDYSEHEKEQKEKEINQERTLKK